MIFCFILLLDCKNNIFNSNGNIFCPLLTYLYEYLTLIVLKNSFLAHFATKARKLVVNGFTTVTLLFHAKNAKLSVRKTPISIRQTTDNRTDNLTAHPGHSLSGALVPV